MHGVHGTRRSFTARARQSARRAHRFFFFFAAGALHQADLATREAGFQAAVEPPVIVLGDRLPGGQVAFGRAEGVDLMWHARFVPLDLIAATTIGDGDTRFEADQHCVSTEALVDEADMYRRGDLPVREWWSCGR